MDAIALTLILLIRVILPVSLLIMLGEWIRRREADYWLRR
jgi:hypothetical protein